VEAASSRSLGRTSLRGGGCPHGHSCCAVCMLPLSQIKGEWGFKSRQNGVLFPLERGGERGRMLVNCAVCNSCRAVYTTRTQGAALSACCRALRLMTRTQGVVGRVYDGCAVLCVALGRLIAQLLSCGVSSVTTDLLRHSWRPVTWPSSVWGQLPGPCGIPASTVSQLQGVLRCCSCLALA
jgi:hypothetical protein